MQNHFSKKHYWLLFISLFVAGFYATAQRVGIGTSAPNTTLHIVGGERAPLRVTSTRPNDAQIDFFTSTSLGGSVGVIFNRMEVMAFNNRNLVLGTNGNNRIFVTTGGSVGFDTETPTEKLTLQNGNIRLNASDKGIMLNGSDQPFITRGFDPFTTGAYTGIGRWGLFMEPGRLTFGIPDIADRAFQWSRYATNSTRTPIMTLDREGKLTRPGRGNADLLPLALGSLSFNGSILGGSGNFSVANFDGFKDVTLSGVVYNSNQYAAVATIVLEGVVGFAMTEAVDGKLRIRTYNQNGTPSNRPVHFVVYKLF